MIPPLATDPRPWSHIVRLAEVQRRSPTLHLSPDAAQREALARMLDLAALHSLEAEVRLTPWLDGAEIRGRWRARIEQVCGVTVEPFETAMDGEFTVRAAPPDSLAIAAETAEVSIDPEAEDPPDVLQGDRVDAAAYVVEHLALEIDPFPRKPGASFTPPEAPSPPSPFAVLAHLAARRGTPPEGES